MIVYILYTMSFTRKIKKNGKIYLAEVENKSINGKVVQKHLRYVGKEVDGQTVLSASISNIEVEEVKICGPLLALNSLAKTAGLHESLGKFHREILSMVYAHCIDYKSVNAMERWYGRTDLAMILGLEDVTEARLLDSLDSLEELNPMELQKQIYNNLLSAFKLHPSGIIYDVTNTYLYGKNCPLAKKGRDKEGNKGRALIQIGLAVTKDSGLPVCHKVLDGNVHDTKMFQDFVTDIRSFNIKNGIVVYDRGVASAKNIREAKNIGWETLCGLPIKGKLADTVRSQLKKSDFINIDNRVRLKKNIYYVKKFPHSVDGVKGTLAICFNEQHKRELRESRYDEIEAARALLLQGKTIKEGMEEYLTRSGKLLRDAIESAEELDGCSCLFSTIKLSKEEMVRYYFDKDIIEKAFCSLKGVVKIQPIRHWLYNRVIAHVFICYLSYLLLSMLQYKLKPLGISAAEALEELDNMYKVYMRDTKKKFKISRTVTLTTKQEKILKAIDRNLLKT